MPSLPGPSNPNWKGGRYLTARGYLRESSGPYRGWYTHRKVVDLCCREWNPWMTEAGIKDIETATGITFHVHHMSFDKTANRSFQLLLLDSRIHTNHNMDGRERTWNGGVVPRPLRRKPGFVSALEDDEQI